jgi:hypothetical protein
MPGLRRANRSTHNVRAPRAEVFEHELASAVTEIQTRHPAMARDKAFVFWFMQAFVTEETSRIIDSVIGGKNDKNIDAIYVDDGVRSTFIIQGKYRTNLNRREERSDIIAFASVADLLFGSQSHFRTIVNNADEGMRPLLRRARHAVVKENYQLALQYVTTGKVSDQHFEEAEEHASEYPRTTFQVFDGRALQRLMQDYIDGAAPPVPTVKLRIEGNEAFDTYDERIKVPSWVFSVNGRELGKLFNRYGVRIFARNIRGFLGTTTSVNRSMRSTVENEPDMFWYFNNGATIVCDGARQIKESGKFYLSISNAQIINGQQTTRTLAEATGAEKIKVLIRVIAVPRSTQQDFAQYNQLVSEIVKATNSQNAIKPADLVANDAEQIRIEREFRKLGYFYARKTMTKGEMRAHYGARNRQIIKRDDLVMALASCTVDPSVVRGGKQQFFVSPDYEKLFNGRSVYEYLAIYWVYMFSKHVYWGQTREVSYSRHLVNYNLWRAISMSVGRRASAERLVELIRNKRYGELKPLNDMIELLRGEAMRCYQKNKKHDVKLSDETTLTLQYAEIDYFKRSQLLRDWSQYWSNRSEARPQERFRRLQGKVFEMLGRTGGETAVLD